MAKAHFENLAALVCARLSESRQSICAAVCWFTHADIFRAMMSRLAAGVEVKLLIECDAQNFKPEGLDFQSFIKAGGQLFTLKSLGLMHHKFVVIDGSLVLNGSFNWTYNSNAENLVVLEERELVAEFEDAFVRMLADSERIVSTQGMAVKAFAAHPLFMATDLTYRALKIKVARGATVWRVNVGAQVSAVPAFYLQRQIFFDSEGVLSSYWLHFPTWDRFGFEAFLAKPAAREQEKKRGVLKKWAIGIRTGDIIVACERKKRSLAIGVVQSEPQKSSLEGYSTYREVQWLEISFPHSAVPAFLNYRAKAPVRHRGSALQLLQAVFTQ